MLIPMFVLLGAGLTLLFTAPLLARLISGRGGDPVGLTRILQVAAVVLLVAALFLRPYNPDSAAIPPPPDSPDIRSR